MKKLKVFIKGETINLSKPTLEFAKKSNWYSWLNDPSIIKYLSDEYKKKKNTPTKQAKFYLKERSKRFTLIISSKKDIYKGVVSLSNFNKSRNSCEIAIITDSKIDPYLSPYAALEAIARITDYAFTKLGVREINSIGKIDTNLWFQRMELFGYKLISIIDHHYINRKKKSPLYISSCTYEDFKEIKKNRKKLWDNLKLLKKRINRLPKKSFYDEYFEFKVNKKEKYYKKIFSL